MSLAPNPAPIFPRCKIKRVNPAFRSVSTPRGTKDLPVVGPVNPRARLASLHGSDSASEWSAERLCQRLRIELAPAARTRLIRVAKRRGVTLEHLLRSALSEVA
jgi:hypothetical protein